MRSRSISIVGVCLGLLLAHLAGAHPYASGLTNQNGAISWVLNEPATDVKILFDNGKVTNDLGASPIVGTNTFLLGAHTNFAIVVYKVGSNTLAQISSDANVNNNFWGPRGVAVNPNPKTWNFGRVYVVNASAGSVPLRTLTKGVYAMDAASEDCLNLGNTGATAGMSLGNNTTYSPYKLSVGPDDYVYIGDAASSVIGGVWRVDPSLKTSANFFGLANPSTNTTTTGTNFGRAIGTPNVSGTLAASNLVLTLMEWDLNYSSNGTYFPTALGYQNLYRYNITNGVLPWRSTPNIVSNPIGLGNVNGVVGDMQIAPDGKYFITMARTTTSDGTTNVCVLDKTGTNILWDSKTQSASYFHDTTNDHLALHNYSIAVSPDDKYVLIQGQVNNNFMIMSLTNGVPDISTLTTNTTVGANGGSTCYAATWDAADNIYVTSGGSDTLRIFSPGLTSTCVTSNDATCTNGGFQLTAVSAALANIQTSPLNQTAECSTNVTFSVTASGANLSYQWYLNGSSAISSATNSSLTLLDVSKTQSGNHYSVVVSNSLNSVTSSPATLTVVDTTPPFVGLNGASPMYLTVGSAFVDPGAAAADACAGSLSVQTSGSVNISAAGTNFISYKATDPSGNSATNIRTVIVLATNGAPYIAQQPSNEIVSCTSPAVISVVAGGAQPFTYKWYDGSTLLSNSASISGAATAQLTLNDTLTAQQGSYSVVISNSAGHVTSQSAAISVNDLTAPALNVLGSEVMTVAQNSSFTDPGATARDSCVGPLPVTTNGSVTTSATGVYIITYSTVNSGGVTATAQRTVTVVPAAGPVAATTPNIIPLPVTMQTRPGVFTLCPAQPVPPAPGRALVQILVDASSQQTGQYLATALAKSTGYQFRLATNTSTNAVKNAILITTSNAVSTLGAEGYELTVAPDSVVIRAPQQGGTFYGVQTLLQLLPPQIYSPTVVSGTPWIAPCVYVQDYPRFPWRGVMLDVARHFFNKDQVKVILDAMAMHKLNTFHWHLVDDQAWRLEITNYPNLTVAGVWRADTDYGLPERASDATNSLGQYGGYYTQQDAREIVAYAAQRHITVVPEIEMPCHSTAGLASYPQFGCGNPVGDYDMDYPSINYGVDLYSLGTPGTMAFLEDALSEVMGIFPSQYIHCGGDEVVSSGDTQWNSYTPDVTNMQAQGITPNGTTSIIAYQHWFSTQIANFVQSKGRTMIGWTEFEAGGVVTNAALMDWQNSASSVTVAEAGLPVIEASDASLYINYIDGTSSNLTNEPPILVGGSPGYITLSNVYSYNPIPSGLPAQYTSNILGAECALWGEYVPSFENVMFKMFPRESALAETTWTPFGQQNLANFTNRLVEQESRFVQMGLNYDHKAIPVLGKWGPSVSTSGTTLFWDVPASMIHAGEIDVNFWYNSGADGLNISSVTLFQNNVQMDIDAHAGFAGATPNYPLYILHLPEIKPGAVYTIQVVIAGSGGTATSGTIYLPNWN
jgi:hexosaminidase